MAFICRFVDAISASPTVRFDFEAGPWEVRPGLDVPPPALRRTVAQSALTDGARVPASAFDNRTIFLPVQWSPLLAGGAGPSEAMSELARELNRPLNILELRMPDASQSTFYRVLRSPGYRTGLEARDDAGLYKLDLELLAEPFGLSLPVEVPEVRVYNRPGTQNFYDVSAPAGDVETPPLLRLGDSYEFDGGVMPIVAQQSGTYFPPLTVLAENAIAPGAPAGTAVVSATGINIPIALDDNAVRLGSLTGAPQVYLEPQFFTAYDEENTGTWRVYASVRFFPEIADGSTARLLTQQVTGNGDVLISDVTLEEGDASKIFRLVDLGTVQLPVGHPEIGYGPRPPAGGLTLKISAARSGSGDVEVDYVTLLPASEHLARMYERTPTADVLLMDAVTGQVVRTKPDGAGALRWQQSAMHLPQWSGSLPMLQPGVANRLYFLLPGDPYRTRPDAYVDVSATYWPRWLGWAP